VALYILRAIKFKSNDKGMAKIIPFRKTQGMKHEHPRNI
jgi:hypothetical protein